MTESNANVVKIALMLANASQAEIASQCGVEPNTVSAVVNGRGRSKRIENRIAVVTGVPRERLWPQWYGPEAQQRRRRQRLSPPEMLARLNALCPETHPKEAA